MTPEPNLVRNIDAMYPELIDMLREVVVSDCGYRYDDGWPYRIIDTNKLCFTLEIT